MSAPRSPLQLAELLGDIERELSVFANAEEALTALPKVAVDRVQGAQYAGITRGCHGRFATVGATDELVEQIDQIQYKLRSGPCVDAALKAQVFLTGDLRNDPRWPRFGWEASQATGIVSMLSLRMYVEDHLDVVAGMNLYSTAPDAFDETDEMVGMVLATAGGLAVTGAAAHEKARNLEIALSNARDIGIAIGVLIEPIQGHPRAGLRHAAPRQPTHPPQTRRDRPRSRRHRRTTRTVPATACQHRLTETVGRGRGGKRQAACCCTPGRLDP